MIYTVTFNPAIDYVIHIDDIAIGMTNRSASEELFFGGKGINVSIVLKALGLDSVAMGFCAGFTGKALVEGIQKLGIQTDFVVLSEGSTRINVKIKAGEETEINGQGPDISRDALDALFQKLDQLQAGDILILAGSVPKSLPQDIYAQIMLALEGRGIRFVVDATGKLLTNTLKYHPFLVKPNIDELGDLFEVRISNEAEISEYAGRLKDMGALNVLVSMAGNGAMLIDEFGILHRCEACRGEVKNSVGAGDSMVAGFVAGAVTGDYDYALRLGTAAGGATAFSEGLANKIEIDVLLKELGSCKRDS